MNDQPLESPTHRGHVQVHVHDYVIRRPTRSDTAPFSTLHAEVWRATYRGIMADRVVDALEPSSFAATWMAVGSGYDEGTIPDDGRGFWVATLDDEPVAFMFFGPGRDEDAPHPRQLYSLNVHPDHQGSGIAQRLLDEGFGPGPAYLWVAKGNERAIRFYQRNGFVLDGTSSDAQHDGVTELRMVRDANRSADPADDLSADPTTNPGADPSEAASTDPTTNPTRGEDD